ncbi:hypothetical protein ACFYVR_24605 [Rhodococcus sp. NPDC003318]|uniref:hypothetical protein n=1 Tax=Rhodococcus sp. NPDC003318 TaxID=3364503 RepID=UPI0036770BD0
MSSSNRGRKRVKKRKQKRQQARGKSTHARIERVELGDLFGSESDAESRLAEIADRIATFATPYNTFDLLALLRLRFETALAADPTAVSYDGAAALELGALVLTARGIQTGLESSEEPESTDLDDALDNINAAIDEAMSAGAMLALATTQQDSSAARELGFGSVMREIFVRNPAYPHMVEDTLTDLFDDPAVEDLCRSVIGCTVQQIRQVFAAMRELYREVWESRATAWAEIADADVSSATNARDVPQHVLDHLRRMADDKSAYPHTTTADIASRSALSTETTQTVLDLFTTPLTDRAPGEAAVDFFRGKSPLRTQPILCAPDGTYAIPHDALFVHSIRERVETALKPDNAAWSAYQKHRGDYLERASIDLLTPHLPGHTLHAAFDYLVPDNEDQEKLAPEQYTKKVEGDGLIVIDDIAIIIEAKAVALRQHSRTGRSGPLWQDLRRMVTIAAEQGDRMRNRILQDRGLRLIDDSWLDLSAIREVHTVAATLDDLSGIATTTHQLVKAGLLTEANIPWIVSLHDLRVISELINRPAELVLYLRRRTDPELTKRIQSADELDYFMYFLEGRLYAEPDPDVQQREVPALGTPSAEQRRRYREQRQTVEFFEPLTDQIDTWYLGELSGQSDAANKPQMQSDPRLLMLVDDLSARREPGWLAMTTTLLSGDQRTQFKFGVMADALAEKTREDGLSHRIACPGGSRRDDSFVLVWMNVVPGTGSATAQEDLVNFVTAKKHQLKVSRGFGMLLEASTGTLSATVYDNRIPGKDAELDTLVNDLNLMDVLSMQRHRGTGRRTKPTPRKKKRR